MKKSLHHNDRMAAARGFFLIATALTLGWGLPTANAADGTYTGNVNANWNVTANWKDGAVADGAGYTATIDRTGFTATRTVTLDSDRTIGSVLVIGAPSQSRNAIIAGTKTLTLNGGSSPSVISNHGWGSATVNPSVISLASDLVVINAPINGSTGEALSGYVTLGGTGATGGSVVSAGGVRTITTQPSTSVTTVSPVNPNDWRIVLSGTVADGSGTIAIRHASGYNLNLQDTPKTFTGGLHIKTGAVRSAGGFGNSALGGAGNIITFEARGATDAAAVLEFSGTISSVNATVDKAAVLAADGVISVADDNAAAPTTINWTGTISGAGSLTKAGPGELRLSGQNTYTGDTIVAGGTLSLGRDGAIAAASALELAGGVLDAAGRSQSFAGLTLSEDATIQLGDMSAKTLAFGGDLDLGSKSLSFVGTTAAQSIRFGTSGGSLSTAELSRITLNGQAVALDNAGYLVPPVAPGFTTHPRNETVTAGQNVSFTVAAGGTPAPTYQWQSSPDGAAWTDIASQTSATLTLTAVTQDMSGTQYRCVATNSVNSAPSNAATLTVNPDPAIVAAQLLKTQLESPGTATVTVTAEIDLALAGGATVASAKTIEGADAGAAIKGGLTLAAGADNTIIRGVTFSGSAFIINGVNDVNISHCTFTDTPVSITGGSDNIAFSWNKFAATLAGTGSAMRISDAGSATGILLDHNFWDAGLAADAPAVTNARVLMINNYLVASQPGGTASTIAGAGAQILSIRNIYEGMNNPIVKESTGLLRALDNIMLNGALAPGEDKVFVPGYSYLVEPAGETPPLDAAAVISAITASAGNTAGKDSASPAATDGAASITASGPGVVTAGAAANVPGGGGFTLTAHATGFTPVARQWYRDNFAITGATGATHDTANANAADHAGAYSVALTTPAGEIVFSGGFTVNVAALEPPAITTHPVSQTVNAGENVTFTVVATGENLAYQWMRNGADISGAASAGYTITGAQQSHAGSYTVRVSNSAGSDTSNPATLTVNAGGGGSGGGGGGAPGAWYLSLIALLVLARAKEARR